MESTPGLPSLSVEPGSLAARLGAVPDRRRTASVCYPLPAVLILTVAATLAGHHSVLAIAQWIARQAPTTLQALGFPPGRVPCQSTLHRILRDLDLAALVGQVQAAFAPITAPAPDALQGIALDGKAQRGRQRFTGWDYAVHAVSAVCHHSGLIVAQEPIAQDPAQHDSELPAATRLLARLEWRNRVLTGDRLYCGQDLCRRVCAAGGAYLLSIGRNRGPQHTAIAACFAAPEPGRVIRCAHTEESGHGRRQERREIRVIADVIGLTCLRQWPGLQQIFQLQRSWWERGVQHTAISYGITSLTPAQAGPAHLLRLRRGHWTIENRVHWSRDVTFGEDASQVRAGAGPDVLSVLRGAAITRKRLHAS